jgi:arylsulfatase A-like enzyme
MNPADALPIDAIANGAIAAVAVAASFAGALLVKSIKDFTRTGPQLHREVHAHFTGYLIYALGRLTLWTFVLASLMAGAGCIAYGLVAIACDFRPGRVGFVVAAAAGLAGITVLRFCQTLVWTPALFAASSQYQMRRFLRLWRHLSVQGLDVAESLLALGTLALIVAVGWTLNAHAEWLDLALLAIVLLAGGTALRWAFGWHEPAPVRSTRAETGCPNILMIGSDTLRADRLGAAGYHRELTPFLDRLGENGTQFTNCYVPCARTAPSLLSLLTGCWPHQHGVRDNFVADDETRLPVPALPQILRDAGYRTTAIGDWAAADMGKFALGFETLDIPADQWNVRYLLRQGPKDIRLFLSMFTRNRFGKTFLPELYYLAGVPLTRQVGRDTREAISRMTALDQPFFVSAFMASTHPPFGSDYPYYTLYADPSYDGESKFAMARLSDPFEIIRRQGDSRTEFDLDQIIDLYDGGVRSFDDEVARIVRHLERCGLARNTIVVIYSDHGMEFFEHETWGQGNSVVSDFSARIPLIVSDPRASTGRNVDAIVRSIDVAPTLLELAGIHPPMEFDGTSLMPLMRGECDDLGLAAYSETGIWLTTIPGMPRDHLRYPDLPDLLDVPDKRTGTLAVKQEFRRPIIDAKDRMVRKGQWKLVYQPMTTGALFKLIDMYADPECRDDVSVQHPEVVSELKLLLQGWMEADRKSLS